MNNASDSMLQLDELKALVGEALLAEARDAVDIETISNFRFDVRGRIEGGIKPAPPSTVKAAYVKVTRRGRRFLVDCARHGKSGWCLHAVILALHHLGWKPDFSPKSKPVIKPREQAPPELGFQIRLRCTPEKGLFKLLSLSTRRYHTNPLAFLQRESGVLKLPTPFVEMLEDVAEQEGSELQVARCDLAPLMLTLRGNRLINDATEKPFQWMVADTPSPRLTLTMGAERWDWRMSEQLTAETVIIPGLPGFIVKGDEVWSYPEHVADLQTFVGQEAGSKKPDASLLAALLAERHGIDWQPERPKLVGDDCPGGLEITVDHGQLHGNYGRWFGNLLIPMNRPNRQLQAVFHQQRWWLVSLSRQESDRQRRARQKLRLPWRGSEFHLRDHVARAFLGQQDFPSIWRVERSEADSWFGSEHLAVHEQWNDQEGMPRYQIGEDWFTHDELLAGMAEDGRGCYLRDGRFLNIDGLPVYRNKAILEGVGRLHEDEDRASDLLRRIRGEIDTTQLTRSQRPELSQHWRELLRDYQKEGVSWLLERFDLQEPALLADDMGLGKTIQTLCFLDTVKSDKPQMVVVPASLIQNWAEEAKRFCPQRKVVRHHGSQRIKSAEDMAACDLVITTYGTLRRDIDMLYDVALQVVVLDEAQAIKNSRSQTARAVGELWSEQRMALTGTPVENRLTELWSLFQFLAAGYLGDEDQIKAIQVPGTAAFEALKAKVRPFLLRREKSTVAKELPEKQEVLVTLPMEPGQAEVYQRVLTQARDHLTNEKQNTMSILTKLLRLRQACCHPGLIDDAYLSAGSAKFNHLLSSLEEILQSGNSVLVFSQFTQLLRLLRYELEEREWGFLYLDGKTRNRGDLVQRFQDGEAPIFLISLKAGGTGLNLTRAAYVFHLDPWWNPMVEAQATDRAHRIGQTQQVMSYKLVIENSIEQRILGLQAGKRALARGLWQEDQAFLSSLGREELLGLLEL